MSKSVIASLVVAGLLVLAIALNPSAERHRVKIRETIAERSQLNKVFGVGELAAFVSTYHSFWVGSYTTAGEKVLSVGVFGIVFVTE